MELIHGTAYRSIKYNLSHDLEESMKDPVIKRLYRMWEEHYAGCEFTWDQIVDAIFASIENLQIKIVNSSKNSEKLEYPKNESLRVIAIGGLALSRGLTLEGLIISYFYRNTCTYDVLMQMGRWFGYRKNYDDLFRIWTHKSSARWYAEIAEATDKLKDDMTLMRDLGQRPRDFGIRVRNNSAELSITAYNKMRNATDEYEFSSYFGGIVETPYLFLNTAAHKNNYSAVQQLVKDALNNGATFERQKNAGPKGHYIIQNIPKTRIVDLIRKLRISRFSSNFDTKQIADFLENCSDKSIDLFDIAFMEGSPTTESDKIVTLEGRSIPKVLRTNCILDKDTDRLGIGQRGKLGGPGDGRTGVIDFNGFEAEQIIENAKEKYRQEYKRAHGYEFTTGKTYPSDTWFKFIKDRKPILLVYFIDVDVDAEESNQKKQINKFREEMNGIPAVGFALGLPQNEDAARISGTKYKANKVYNWFEQEEILAEAGEEE